jgi:hypothetical protein
MEKINLRKQLGNASSGDCCFRTGGEQNSPGEVEI